MMKIALVVVVMVVTLGTWFVGAAYAQKGTGDATGVAQQAVKPEIVAISGKLLEIKTGPCEATTGHSSVGTHIILETAEKEKVNVHLGPAAAVAETVAKLTVGQEITVKAFRTDKLKNHHYVATSITFDKTTVEFRDDTLRPVWAQGGGAGRGPGWRRGGMRWRGGR
jgi:hypothetical protein